jgi:osmotically-inducible protein OsmY
MATATVAPDARVMRRKDPSTPVPAAPHVQITIAGGTARLTGQVSSWTAGRDIERAVCDAPGVVRVENLLQVVPHAR